MRRFRLVPFPGGALPAITVEGAVNREADVLSASFRVRGGAGKIAVPGRAQPPARLDGLWQSTCFELFAAPRGDTRYLEVNVSPSGNWNVYRFASYREGMSPIDPVALTVKLDEAASESELGVDLSLALPEGFAGVRLDVGICAVIELTGGSKLYYALGHHGDRADFHERHGFELTA